MSGGEFAGRRALVTVGASGIGLVTARMLAGRGARVVCLDLDDAIDEPLIGVRADVIDDQTVRAGVAAAVDRLGGLDILVNNAGIDAQGTVADNDDAEWHRVYDVNVVGMVRVSRAALPHLKTSPAAVIVNTRSIAATAGLPQRALYSAAKGPSWRSPARWPPTIWPTASGSAASTRDRAHTVDRPAAGHCRGSRGRTGCPCCPAAQWAAGHR